MNHASRIRPRMRAVAAAAGAFAVMGSTLTTFRAPAADASQQATGRPAASAPVTSLRLYLSAMPEGVVIPAKDGVQVVAFGFTPGSSHLVELAAPHGAVRPLGQLKANATGLASGNFSGYVPSGSRVLIRDGAAGTDLISTTPPLDTGVPRQLSPVSYGQELWGDVAVTYSPRAHTLTLTLDAFGVSPGAHAAHIHKGTCLSQGAVVYGLKDFVADANGDIVNQTRVVTGVTSFPSKGWYFNLHQGNSENILRKGQPSVDFRPLLCSNI